MGSPASSSRGYSRPQASTSNPRRMSPRLWSYKSNSESMCKRPVGKASLNSKKRKYENPCDSSQTSKSCTGCSNSKSLTLLPNASVSARSTDVPFSLDISDCLTDASQWEAMEIRFLENDKCTLVRPNMCQSLSVCEGKKVSPCTVSGDATTTASICGGEPENIPSRRPICRQTVRVEKVHVRNLLNTNRERCGNLSSSRLSEYVPPYHGNNITYNSEGEDSSETVSSLVSDGSVSSLDSRTATYDDGHKWKEKSEKGVKQDSDDTEVESSDESDNVDDDDDEEEEKKEFDGSVEETCLKSKEGESKKKESVWLKKKDSDMGCSFSQNNEKKSATPKARKKIKATESGAKNVEYLQHGSISQERRHRAEKSVESSISSENIWTQNSDVIECFCSSSHDYRSDGGKLHYFSEPINNKKEDKCPTSTKETMLKDIKKDAEKKRGQPGYTDCHNKPRPSAASKSPKTSFTRMSDEEMTLYKQTALQILMQRKRHAQFVDMLSPKQTTDSPNHWNTQNKNSSPALRLSSHRYKQFTPRLNYASDLHKQIASGRVNGQTEKNKPRATAVQESSHTSTPSHCEFRPWQPKKGAMIVKKNGFRRKSRKSIEKLSDRLSSNLMSWSWNSETIKNVSKPINILQRRNSTPAATKIKWPTSASKSQAPASIRTIASKTMNSKPVMENKFVSVAQQTDSLASLHSDTTIRKKRMTKSVQTAHVPRPNPHIISHSEYQNSTSESKRMTKSLIEKKRTGVDLFKRSVRSSLSENRKTIKQNKKKRFPIDLKAKSLKSQTMQKSVPAKSQSKLVEKQNSILHALSREKTNEGKKTNGNIPEAEQPSEMSTVLPTMSSSKEKDKVTSSLPSNVASSMKSDSGPKSSNTNADETEQLKRKPDENPSGSAGSRMGYLELLQNILKSPTARASQAVGRFLQKPDTIDATAGVNEMTVDQIINSYQEIFDEIKAMSSSSSTKGESKQQDTSGCKQESASDQTKSVSRPLDSQSHAASNAKQGATSYEKVTREGCRETKESVSHTKQPSTAESKKREGQRLSLSFQKRSRSCQDWGKKDDNPKATNKSNPSLLLPQPTGQRAASSNIGNKFHNKIASQPTKSVVWKSQAQRAKPTDLQQKARTGEATFAGLKQVKSQDTPLKNQMNRASVTSSSGFKLSVKSQGDQQPQTENPLPGVYVIGASRRSDHKMLILSNPTSGPMLVKPSLGHASIPPGVSKSYPTVISKNEGYLIRGTYLTFGQEDSSIVKIEDPRTGKNQLQSPRQGRSVIKKYIRANEPYQEDALNSLRTCPTITIIAPQACVSISPKKSTSIDISTAGAAMKKHEHDRRKYHENIRSKKSKSGVSTATQTRYRDRSISNWALSNRFKLHTSERALSKKELPSTSARDYTVQTVTPKASLNWTLDEDHLKSCKSFTQTQGKYASKKNEPKQLNNTSTLLANRHGNQNPPRINFIRKNQSADTLKHQSFSPQSPFKQIDRPDLRDINKPKQTDAAVARARNMHVAHSNITSTVSRADSHRIPTRCLSRARDKLAPKPSEPDKQPSGFHYSRLTNSNIKLNPNLIRQKLPGDIISSVNNIDTHILKDHATNSKSAATCFLSSSRYQNLAWWAKKPKYNTKRCHSASNVQERKKPYITSSSAWKTKPYGKIDLAQMRKIQPVGGIQTVGRLNSIENNVTGPASSPNLINNTPNTTHYSSPRLNNAWIPNSKLKWPLTLPMPAESNNLREEDLQNQMLTEKCEHAIIKSQSQSVDRLIGSSGFSPFLGKKNKPDTGHGKELTLRKSTSCVNVFKIGNDTRMPQTKISRESNVIKTSTAMREEHFKSSVSVMEAGDNTLWLSRHRKEENRIDESIKSSFFFNEPEKDEVFSETNNYKNGSLGPHKKSNFSEDDSEASDWGNLQNLRQHAVAKTCEMILHETRTMIDPTRHHPRADESEAKKIKYSSPYPFTDIKERAAKPANSSLYTGGRCVEERDRKYPDAFQSREMPTWKSFQAIKPLQKAGIGHDINTFNDRKSPYSEDSTDSSAPTEAVREEKEIIKASYGLQTSSQNVSLVSGNNKKTKQFYITKEQPKSPQIYDAFPASTKEKNSPQLERSQIATANVEKKNLEHKSVGVNLKHISNVALSIPGLTDIENSRLERGNHSWPPYSHRKLTQARTLASHVAKSNNYGFKDGVNVINQSRWLPENNLKSLVTVENTVFLSQSAKRNLASTETQTDMPDTTCRECLMQRALPDLQMGNQLATHKESETQEPVKTIPAVEKGNAGWGETFTCKDKQSALNSETFEVTTDGEKQLDKQCDEKALVAFPVVEVPLQEDLIAISTLETESSSEISRQDDMNEKIVSSTRSPQENFCCPTKANAEHEKEGRQPELFLTGGSNTEKITEKEIIPNSDVVLSKGQFHVICDSLSKGNRGDLKEMNSDLIERNSELCPKSLTKGWHEQDKKNYLLNSNAGMPEEALSNERRIITDDQEFHPQAAFDYKANVCHGISSSELGFSYFTSEVNTLGRMNIAKSNGPHFQSTNTPKSKPSWKQLSSDFVKCFCTWIAHHKEHDVFEQQSLFGSSSHTQNLPNQFQRLLPRDAEDAQIVKCPFDGESKLRLGATDISSMLGKQINILDHEQTKTSNTVGENSYLRGFDSCRQSSSMENLATCSDKEEDDRMIKTENDFTWITKPSDWQVVKGKSDAHEFCNDFKMGICTSTVLNDDTVIKNSSVASASQSKIIGEQSDGWKPVEEIKLAGRDQVVRDSLIREPGTERHTSWETLKGEPVIRHECSKEHISTKYSEDVSKPTTSYVQSSNVHEAETDMETVTSKRSVVDGMATHLPPVCNKSRDKRKPCVLRKFSSKFFRTSSSDVQDADQETTCRRSSSVTELVNTTPVVMDYNKLLCTSDETDVAVQNIKLTDNEVPYQCQVMDTHSPCDSRENTMHSETISDFNLSTSIQKSPQKRKPLLADLNICEIYQQLPCNDNKQEKNDKSNEYTNLPPGSSTVSNQNASTLSRNVDKKNMSIITQDKPETALKGADNGRILLRHKGMDYKLIHQKAMENLESFLRSIRQDLDRRGPFGSWSLLSSPPKKPCRENTRRYGSFPIDKLDVKTSHSCFQQSARFTDCSTINVNEPVGPHSVFSLMTIEAEKSLKNATNKTESEHQTDSSKPSVNKGELIDSLICMNENELQIFNNNVPPVNGACESFIASPGHSEKIYHPLFMISPHSWPKEPCFQSTVCKNKQSQEPPLPTSPLTLADLGMSKESSPVPLKHFSAVTHPGLEEDKYKPLFQSGAISNKSPTSLNNLSIGTYSTFPFINSPNAPPPVHDFSHSPQEMSKNPFSPSNANPFLRHPSPLTLPITDCIPTKCVGNTSWGHEGSAINVKTLLQRSPPKLSTTACNSFSTGASPNFTQHQCLLPDSVPVNFGLSGEEIESFFGNTSVKEAEGSSGKQLKDKTEHDISESDIVKDKLTEVTEYLMIFSDSSLKYAQTNQPPISGPSHSQIHTLRRRNNHKNLPDSASQLSANIKPKTKTDSGIPSHYADSNDICVFDRCLNQLYTNNTKRVKIISQLNNGDSRNWQQSTHKNFTPNAPLRQVSRVHTLTDDTFGMSTEKSQEQAPHSTSSEVEDSKSCESNLSHNYSTSASSESLCQFRLKGDRLLHTPVLIDSDLSRESESIDTSWKQYALSRTSSTSSSSSSQLLRSASLFPCSETPLLSKGTKSHNAVDTHGFFTLQLCDKAEKGPHCSKDMHQDILKTVTTLTSQVIYIFSDLKDMLNGTPEKAKCSRTVRSRRGRRFSKSTWKKNRSSRPTSGRKKKKTLFGSSAMPLCLSDNTTITQRKNCYRSEMEPCRERSKKWKQRLQNANKAEFSSQPKGSILKKWVDNTPTTFGVAAKESSSLNDFSRGYESLPLRLSKSSEILSFKTMAKNSKYQRWEEIPAQLSTHTDLTKKPDGGQWPSISGNGTVSATTVKSIPENQLRDDEEFTSMVNGRQNYNQEMEKKRGDDIPSDLVNTVNDTYFPAVGYEKECPNCTETFQENKYIMPPYFYTTYFLNHVFRSKIMPPFTFWPPLLVAVEEKESKKESAQRQFGLGNCCQSKNLIQACGEDNVDLEERVFFVDDLDLDRGSGLIKSKEDKISPPADISDEDSIIQSKKPLPKQDLHHVLLSKENEHDWVESESAHFSSENVCKWKNNVSEDSVLSCHNTQTLSGFVSPKCTYDGKEILEYPNSTKKFGRLNNDSKSLTMFTSPPKRRYEADRRRDSMKSGSFLMTDYCFTDKSPVLERKLKHTNDRPYHSDEECDINSSTHNNIPHPKNYLSQQNDAFYGTKPFTQTCSYRGYEHPINTIIYRVDSTPLSGIESEFNEDNKRIAYSEIKMKPSAVDEFTADLNEPDTYDELRSLRTEILETSQSSCCSDISTMKCSDSLASKDYSVSHLFQLGKSYLSAKGNSLSVLTPCHAKTLTLTPLERSALDESSNKQFQDKETTYTRRSKRNESKDCNVDDPLISRNKHVQATFTGPVDSEISNLTACSKPISSFTETDAGNIADTLSVTETKTHTLSEINRFVRRCVKSNNFNHHIQNIVDDRLQKTLASMSIKCITDPTDDMEPTRVYCKLPSMFGGKEDEVKSCSRAATQRRKTDSPTCSKMVDMIITADRFLNDCESENDQNSSNRESVHRVNEKKVNKEGNDYSHDQRFGNIENKKTKLLSDLNHERSTASFERPRKPLFGQSNIHTILTKYLSPPKCSRSRNDKRGCKRKDNENNTAGHTISPFSSCPIALERKTHATQGNSSLPIIRSLKRDNTFIPSAENKTCKHPKTINRECMTSPADGTAENHLAIQAHHIVDSAQTMSSPAFKTQIPRTLSSPKAVEAIINCSSKTKRPQSYNWRKDKTYVTAPSITIDESFGTSSSSSLKHDYGELGNVLSAESKLLWNKISCLEKNYERCKMCRKRYNSIIGKRDRRIMAASKIKSLGQPGQFFKKRSYLNIARDKYNECESQKVREKIDEKFDFIPKTTTLQTAKVNRLADLQCSVPKVSNIVVDKKPFLTDPCSLSQDDKDSCTRRKSGDMSVEKLTDPATNKSSTKSLTFNIDRFSVPEELRRTSSAKNDPTQKRKRNMHGAHTAQMVRLFETGEAFLNDKKTNEAVENKVGSLKAQERYCFASSKWNFSPVSPDQNQSKSAEIFETEEEPWQPRWIDTYSVDCEGCLVTSLQTGNERPVKKADKHTRKFSNKQIYDLHLNCQLPDSTYLVVPAVAHNSIQEQTDASPMDFFIERLVDILDEMHQIFPQALFPCTEPAFPVFNRGCCSSAKTGAKNENILRQKTNHLSTGSASKWQCAPFNSESVLKSMDDSGLLRNENNKLMFQVGLQHFKPCNSFRTDTYTQALNSVIKDDESTSENYTKNVPNYSANCHEATNDRGKTLSFFISSQEPYNEQDTFHVTDSDNPLVCCRYQTWEGDIPEECNGNCQDPMKDNDSFLKDDEEKILPHVSDSLTFSQTFRCHDLPQEFLVTMAEDETFFRTNCQKSKENERLMMSSTRPSPVHENLSCHAKFSVQREEKIILLEEKTHTERRMSRTSYETEHKQAASFSTYDSEKVNKTGVMKDSNNDLNSEHQKCTSYQGDLTSTEKNVEEYETESSRLFSVSRYLTGLYMLSRLDKNYAYIENSKMICNYRSFTDICEDKNTCKKSNSCSSLESRVNHSSVGSSFHCDLGSGKKEEIKFVSPSWIDAEESQSNHDIKTAVQELNQQPSDTSELQMGGPVHDILKKNPKISHITSFGCHGKKNDLNVSLMGNDSCKSIASHRGQNNSHSTLKNPNCQANSDVHQFLFRSTSLSHMQNKKTMGEILTDKEAAGKEAAGSSTTDSPTNCVKTRVLWRHAENNNTDTGCPSLTEHKDANELLLKSKLYSRVGEVHSLDSKGGCQGIGERRDETPCPKRYVPAATQCTDGLESQKGECVLVKDYFRREAFKVAENVHTTPIDQNNKQNIELTSKEKRSEQSFKNGPAGRELETRNNSSQFQEIPVDIYTVPLRKSCSLGKKKRTRKCENLQTRTIVISGPIMNLSVPVHRHNRPIQEDDPHLACYGNGVERGASNAKQTEVANKSTADCNESRKMNSKWRDAMRRILPFGRKN